jgi:hypothetical protein
MSSDLWEGMGELPCMAASAVMGRLEGLPDVGWVPYLLLKKRPLPVAAAPLKTGLLPGEVWTPLVTGAV